MLKTLYSKLALAQLVVFCIMAALLIYTMGAMIDGEHLPRMVSQVVIGAVTFALATGLIVFSLLTRRLRDLASAVDTFRGSNFSAPVKPASASPNGDEIDRLAFAFEQMEVRMIGQLQRLQQVDTQRRELLANVSHDLRTPLASMRGYLETLLLKEGAMTQQEQRHYLEVAAKQTERLSKLVGDLFQLTKLEANEVVTNPETFPLSELVQDVAQKFTLAADKKSLRIEVDFPEQLPLVHADIGLIERVFENLIENAMRYTASGGVIRLSLVRNDAGVEVRISDTGQGMEPDELNRIFERYYRADRAEVSDSGHAGLGLAIAQRIVTLHGSSMRVDSQRGVGTTFSFDLPLPATLAPSAPG